MKASSRRNFVYIVLFFVPVILSFIWFRTGHFLAGGEEALSIWNSRKFAEAFRYAWFETGTGIPSPTLISRVVLYSFATLLSKFLPIYFVQSLVFLSLMLTGVFSTFLLSNYIIKNNRKVAMIASLFYLLNLYSQTQVWARFLYAGMFAWAYLPLFLFLWIKWLREGKLRYTLLFAVTNFLFSNTFSQPAYLFTFWIPAGIFAIVDIWAKKRDRFNFALLLLARSFVGIFLFTVVNIWWIFPFLKISSSSFGLVSDWKTNFDSLRGVSQYFTTNQILLLRQSYLFGKDSLWFSWYNQPWVWLVSVLILVIVIVGWVSSRKTQSWKWLTSLAFVGWFVGKGSNPPFGFGFFNWLFSNFPFMAVLRNPYEKFGLVWLLPYSIFFGLGLMKIKNKLARIGILFLACGMLVWPMWTGDIYKNARVRVPDYYKQANDYLNQDKSSGRILMLPIIPGDGVRYSWSYQGLEPSEFLFDKTSISKMLRAKYFDDKYFDLYKKFISGGDYGRNLQEMNIKFLVLHHDLDAKISGASSSAEVVETLSKNPQIKLLEKFGDLDIYEFKSENLDLFKTDGPEIEYTKLSPTKYDIKINDAKKPYKLIFKETFDKNWIARIDGKVQENHFLIFDYANAWDIDRNGSYNIQVVFKVWPWD